MMIGTIDRKNIIRQLMSSARYFDSTQEVSAAMAAPTQQPTDT